MRTPIKSNTERTLVLNNKLVEVMVYDVDKKYYYCRDLSDESSTYKVSKSGNKSIYVREDGINILTFDNFLCEFPDGKSFVAVSDTVAKFLSKNKVNLR